jgi:soluble lytic murein transglycosylase
MSLFRLIFALAVVAALVVPAGAWLWPAPDDPPPVWHEAERLRGVLAAEAPSRADVLAAVRAELALGRAEHARSILIEHGGASASHPETFPLLADAAYQSGEHEIAGALYSRWAAHNTGVDRGVFMARAGDAYERAGMRDSAKIRYRDAARQLRSIAGWLALREARVTDDPVQTFALLRETPPEAEHFAAEIRADLFLAAGDTAQAIASFLTARLGVEAARLAVAVGDTAVGQRLALDALRSRDTNDVRGALELLAAGPNLDDPEELIAVAAAYRRLRQRAEAVAVARQAARYPEAAARVVRLWGDLEVDVGRLRTAIDAYERAAALGGGEGALAEYKRARQLSRSGQASQGSRALLAFARDHPGHALAPQAVYLVAERHRRARRYRLADSLHAAVARGWPTHEYAGRSRLVLATRGVAQGDTSRAMEWYEAEVAVRGPYRNAAQFFSAQLVQGSGDTSAARRLWTALGREDSLGYYGTMARATVGMPRPRFEPHPRPVTALAIRVMLDRIDLLHAAGMEEGAEEVVRLAVALEDRPVQEALDLAEGLIERGWVSQGIRLGWRAARTLTLNDPRVVRVIFPWPLRDLIEREAAEYGVDPYLLAGLIRQESSFMQQATSRAGARGLMQLMPQTAKAVARRVGIEWSEELLGVADANLHVGTAHLTALLKTYDGDVILSLAAYNAGGRPVARWRRYPEASDPLRFVERVPYEETRGYLKTVLRNIELYRALHPPDESIPGDGP